MVALLVAHSLHACLKFLEFANNGGAFVVIVELFILFILGYAALHKVFEAGIGHENDDWSDNPLVGLVAMVVFGVFSMIIYAGSRYFEKR